MKVSFYDTNFSHDPAYIGTKDMELSRIPEDNEVAIYTDSCYDMIKQAGYRHKINCFWLVEPRSFSNYYMHPFDLFDIVFTHDKDLIDSNPDKFKYVTLGNTWIKEPAIYEKTKNTSIIASFKNQLEGHRLRHECIKKLSNVDVYGNGYNKIQDKLTALKDYRYSIVIENEYYDWWFTEKIIDCFSTGTIPIYWGCPSIGNHFTATGIINFYNVDELQLIMDQIIKDPIGIYNSRIPAVKENFEKSKYFKAEEMIYEHLKGL